MRTTKTETVEVTRTIEVDTTCDLCGDVSKNDWKSNGCDALEIEVHMRTGNQYGADGGSVEQSGYDVCPTCFVNKVIPWFNVQGANLTVTKHEW